MAGAGVTAVSGSKVYSVRYAFNNTSEDVTEEKTPDEKDRTKKDGSLNGLTSKPDPRLNVYYPPLFPYSGWEYITKDEKEDLNIPGLSDHDQKKTGKVTDKVNNQKVHEQDQSNNEKITVGLGGSLDLGMLAAFYDNRPYSDAAAYQGWQNNFLPPSTTMDITNDDTSTFMQAHFGASGGIKIGAFSVGPRVELETFGADYKSMTLQWWDPVKLETIKVEPGSGPTLGVSADVELSDSVILNATYMVPSYRVVEQDYAGTNCVDCKNTSSVSRTTTLEEGNGQRGTLIVYIATSEEHTGYFGVGGFYQSIGKQESSGLSLSFMLRDWLSKF